MREMGVCGLLVHCSDYHCGHSVALSADRWPDDVRLSDLELLFVCQACGTRPAELRPDFNWARKQPPVPELTGDADIKLNARLRLIRDLLVLSSFVVAQ